MTADLFGNVRTAPELRPYQTDAIAEVDAALDEGARAPLLVCPTGSGKTVIAAEIIRRHRGRALFLAPRRELIHQASEKLTDLGIVHGILLAGREDLRDLYAPVQVGSIDTIVTRMRRRAVLPPELVGIDLVIIDEAHLGTTALRTQLLEQWPGAIRIGLTATPTRLDGRALGMMFDRLIAPVTTAELTAQGYLAPARYFSLSEPDLERVRVLAGDFNQGELENAVNRPGLVGDVVGTWLRRAADRQTVVFCVGVAHSIAMAEEFLRAGVSAEHVDGTLSTDDRERIIARFRSGVTQVLTNCQVASYGFDEPGISCIVLAKPTKSLTLYLQMTGRGLRTAPGKPDCLVLDHSGSVHRFGFATDPREWTLDGMRSLAAAGSSQRKEEADAAKQIDCPECKAVFSCTRTCPECGYHLRPPGRTVETLKGDLVEIGAGLPDEGQDRLQFFLELRGLAIQKSYKPTWAAVNFRERYGEWPPRAWNQEAAMEPSMATRRWVKSRLIAFAKQKSAEGAA